MAVVLSEMPRRAVAPSVPVDQVGPDSSPTARKYLFAHWEGGGNTPPMLASCDGCSRAVTTFA